MTRCALALALLGILGMLGAACRRSPGDPGSTAVSCQFNAEECLEHAVERADELRDICTAHAGAFRQGSCPEHGASGRCTIAEPPSVRVYYGLSQELGEKTCVGARAGTYARVR